MLLYENRLRRFVADDLFAGLLSAYIAEKRLRAEQEKCLENEAPGTWIPEDLLIEEDQGTLLRLKSLEEKAKGNLFALTVCSSVIFSALALATNHDALNSIKNIRQIFLLVGIPLAYFAASGFSAVRVLQVGQIYEISSVDAELPPGAIRSKREWCLRLNRITGLIKANWTWVSFTCLRNAVICLFLFMVIAICSLALAHVNSTQPDSVRSLPRLQQL